MPGNQRIHVCAVCVVHSLLLVPSRALVFRIGVIPGGAERRGEGGLGEAGDKLLQPVECAPCANEVSINILVSCLRFQGRGGKGERGTLKGFAPGRIRTDGLSVDVSPIWKTCCSKQTERAPNSPSYAISVRQCLIKSSIITPTTRRPVSQLVYATPSQAAPQKHVSVDLSISSAETRAFGLEQTGTNSVFGRNW